MMKRKKNQPRFLEAFSPTIMESTVPKRFVDIVNEVGDTVLSDDVKRCQVGLVTQACWKGKQRGSNPHIKQ